MRKLSYRAFGGLDVLELADVAVPKPAPGQVLVRVRAAAINPIDWKMREGHVKFLTGWRMPQGQGVEFAGVVEQVGRGVTSLAVGDQVFGAAKSSIAEYCVAKTTKVARIPSGVSFEVAATIACVGTTAARAFRRVVLGAGSDVLINGATGGIGTYATQMAVGRGASVTAVVSDKGLAVAEQWGVERVVNYRTTNILDEGRTYDLVIELSDKLPHKLAKALLNPGGRYVATLPNPAEFVPGLLGNMISSRKYALAGMRAKTEELQNVAHDVAVGKINVMIGDTFALSDYRPAYEHAQAGKHLGKVVFVLD